MRFKYKYKTVRYYSCLKDGCQAKATVDATEDVITNETGKHMHDNSLCHDAVTRKVKKKVSSLADNPTVPPRAVFAQVVQEVLADPETAPLMAYLPKPRTVARTLQRARAEDLGCGAIPNDWESMIIPDCMKETFDKGPFMILETDAKNGGKIFGFASRPMLAIMDGAADWFLDGTWDIVAHTLFVQV